MGRFDHILIVTDLDYTFLGEGGALVPRNLEALARFREQGGKFTIATGRNHVDAVYAIPNLAQIINAPAIVGNGTYLYDMQAGKVLEASPMDFETTYEAVCQLRRELPELALRVTTDNGVLTDYLSPTLAKVAEKKGADYFTVVPLEEWKPGVWYKVACQDTPQGAQKMYQAFIRRYADLFESCFSEPGIFEWHAIGCGKGVYVDRLREYYRKQEGFTPTVYACGDYENDREMLGGADVAVCPSNAIDSIKEICDFCLCDHKQGVIADLIELLEKQAIEEGK